MIPQDNLHPGLVCRHHSGKVYTVLALSNGDARSDDPRFRYTVHYIGANGNQWSRPIEEFMQKFTILYDGTNLAPEPEPETITFLDIVKKFGVSSDDPLYRTAMEIHNTKGGWDLLSSHSLWFEEFGYRSATIPEFVPPERIPTNSGHIMTTIRCKSNGGLGVGCGEDGKSAFRAALADYRT